VEIYLVGGSPVAGPLIRSPALACERPENAEILVHMYNYCGDAPTRA
jgi:hypothetical protein